MILIRRYGLLVFPIQKNSVRRRGHHSHTVPLRVSGCVGKGLGLACFVEAEDPFPFNGVSEVGQFVPEEVPLAKAADEEAGPVNGVVQVSVVVGVHNIYNVVDVEITHWTRHQKKSGCGHVDGAFLSKSLCQCL